MNLLFLFQVGVILGSTFAQDPACGDWERYKDEKCIKVLDDVKSYDDAVKLCHTKDATSSLLSIGSAEEQTFMENLLVKTLKVVDGVWLGARLISNKYKWADDSDVKYTNWAPNKPTNSADKACVQIVPEGYKGKWTDEPCNKKNLVVCQKAQTWSIAKLQQTLLDTRKELTNANHKIDTLKKNPVPIGFIYVQLPKEKSPSEVWPTLKWTDVSANYDGVFFRVSSGSAASFGAVQEESTPRLVAIQSSWSDHPYRDHFHYCYRNITIDNEDGHCYLSIPKQGESGWTLTGSFHGTRSDLTEQTQSGTFRLARFITTGGEVRPRNMAMRVWKRIA